MVKMTYDGTQIMLEILHLKGDRVW